MSAQAAKRKRREAVLSRPGGLRRRLRTKQQLVSGGVFGGKKAKTAQK